MNLGYDYFSSTTFTDYKIDLHKRRDVERWVENIVNLSIDVGKIILASMKKKIPDYYKDTFLELSFMLEFRESGVEKMAKWVKLRNILAHEYLDIRWSRIEDFIRNCKESFCKFLEIVKGNVCEVHHP